MRETGFYDVGLATTKHVKNTNLGVILEEFDNFHVIAKKQLFKTSNAVGSGYVSKLGVLGTDFETFCEI